MTDRLKSLRRVLKVQDQLKRSADWRLAEAQRVVAEVAASKVELARFRDGELLTGPLGVAAAVQARRLDARGIDAEAAEAAETQAMRDATARQKLVAKGVETLARDEAAARDRKDLERLIESFTARRGAGGETEA